ncbi:hypothetical protein Lesp02_23820 [Lentzea sp. NBRC 105346]|uniref:DUF3558 family protein n=1 Tax=Lentzea sp. NBRC 105346 TaxID=3032205 RepID=UPI0024A160AC|nr:DUF3558 family protein [Lentzea sp. NBRC 105346]GLZ30192.1 hypothetical protein Lesp02_23820 [Lentzea sp. NBRC 105346]
MIRTRIAIVGLALLATACTGGKTEGSATTGTPTQDTPTSTSSAAGDGKLASVKPCELISSSEATTLELKSPEARRAAGTDTCEWTGTNRGGLTVSIDLKQGADDYNFAGDTKVPVKAGKYEGYKVPAAKGDKGVCDVVIAVTGSSSVLLVGQTSLSAPDTEKACELATKSAELVAAKL